MTGISTDTVLIFGGVGAIGKALARCLRARGQPVAITSRSTGSPWVVHNVPAEFDRNLAPSEMVRVLRHGGHLVVADISDRDAYLAKLQELELSDCRTLYQPVRDAVLGALSFGSFRPSVVIGRLPSTPDKS